MPSAFFFPMMYCAYTPIPLFNIHPPQFQPAYFGMPAPPPRSQLSRPVMVHSHRPFRKDYLAEAVARRESRVKQYDMPADSDLGPLRPDWIERVRAQSFGNANDRLEPDSSDDEDNPPYVFSYHILRSLLIIFLLRPKRQRTAAQMKSRAHHRRNFEENRTISAQKVGRISRQVEKKVTEAQVNYSQSIEVRLAELANIFSQLCSKISISGVQSSDVLMRSHPLSRYGMITSRAQLKAQMG